MLPIFLWLQKYFKVVGSWCIVSVSFTFMSVAFSCSSLLLYHVQFSHFLNYALTTALQNFKENMPNTKHNAAKNSASSEF